MTIVFLSHFLKTKSSNSSFFTNGQGALTLTTDGDVPLEFENWTLSVTKF